MRTAEKKYPSEPKRTREARAESMRRRRQRAEKYGSVKR